MKRFWETAAVLAEGAAYGVALDGRPVRLSTGTKLRVGHRALAEAVAAEWQAAGGAKGGDMSWDDVPLTCLAGTAQERIAPDPEPVALSIARYGETDLLCYRADYPDELVRRQHLAWQPWLDWAEDTYGAPLRVTTGIVHVAQAPTSLAALAQAVAAHDPVALAALGVAVPVLGSLVLGLALAAFRLDAAEAHALATLDETFQAELWGVDDEAEARRCRMREEVALARRALELSR
jgi:chaperone required for assembly of F1-ATPase